MNTTEEFRDSQAGRSQNEKLEAHFRQHPNQWLDLPDLVDVAGGYAVHSRVSDLRARGMVIEQKNTYATEEGSGKVFSRYRFNVAAAPEASPVPCPVQSMIEHSVAFELVGEKVAQ